MKETTAPWDKRQPYSELEPLGNHRVRVLEYHRKQRGGSWRRCHEEEGRVLDYRKLGLPQAYDEVF